MVQGRGEKPWSKYEGVFKMRGYTEESLARGSMSALMPVSQEDVIAIVWEHEESPPLWTLVYVT